MIEKKKKYKLGDFDYRLPKKFIAQHPESRRDYAKLMVVNKDTGEIEHRKFLNIIDYMRKNDLLVLNNTKVFPARLFATKDRTDAKVEVFLLRELANDLWEVMVRPARKVRIGNKLMFQAHQCIFGGVQNQFLRASANRRTTQYRKRHLGIDSNTRYRQNRHLSL